MTDRQLWGCIAFAVMLSAGQILFKSAALAVPTIKKPLDFLSMAQVPVLWLAVLLYGSATLLWIYLLQSTPLSRAYPFAALGFVLVPVAGMVVFGERLSLAFLAGTMLVLAGLFIIAKA